MLVEMDITEFPGACAFNIAEVGCGVTIIFRVVDCAIGVYGLNPDDVPPCSISIIANRVRGRVVVYGVASASSSRAPVFCIAPTGADAPIFVSFITGVANTFTEEAAISSSG